MSRRRIGNCGGSEVKGCVSRSVGATLVVKVTQWRPYNLLARLVKFWWGIPDHDCIPHAPLP